MSSLHHRMLNNRPDSDSEPDTSGDLASDDDGGPLVNERPLTRRRRPPVAVAAVPSRTGKTVLVTGGAGFIGSHVAEVLLSRGDRVVVVDEMNDYYDINIKRANLEALQKKHGGLVSVHEGDVCDANFIGKVFEEEKPKYVVHMAARAGVRPSIDDPFVYVHSNVEATTRLLDLARKHGNESFVFASSSSVYGGSKASLFSEDDVVDHPVSPYAATKKAKELMAYTYHHLYGLNIAGLRFFTVYGPRGRPDMAPFKFVDRVARGVELQRYGDGTSSRDYTYIDDIVDGTVRALDRPLGYQIYNLGRGDSTSLNEFIEIVEEKVGKKAIVRVLPDQPGDVPRTCADISKARRLLGYNPQTPFAEGMAKTVAWYQNEYAPMMAAREKAAEAPITRSQVLLGRPLPPADLLTKAVSMLDLSAGC